MYQMKEGLISVHDVASVLDADVQKVDYHYRYHEAHISSKDLVKIVMKVKSDLLDVYEELQRTFSTLKDNNDPSLITLKINVSKEIRSLKKDLDDFIKKHSSRIAMEHQDLEKQWKRMSEFFAHDACNECKIGLLEYLEEDDD
jgi:molecular chaperone GrpE (heat shock protein)